MSTIHLFDDLNNGAKDALGDLEKTVLINELMAIPFAARDQQWRESFLSNLADAHLQYADPEVILGPDGFPYINVKTIEKNTDFKPFVLKNKMQNTILKQGFGIALNIHNEQPDWIFSFGDLVNYSLNNEFYTDDSIFSTEPGNTVIGQDEEILVGQPAETILPKEARMAIREFLEYNGLKNPKIMLIARNYKSEETVRQDLVFNIIPKQFATEKEYKTIMETISWFLPRHYSIIGLDEMSVGNGFMPL